MIKWLDSGVCAMAPEPADRTSMMRNPVDDFFMIETWGKELRERAKLETQIRAKRSGLSTTFFLEDHAFSSKTFLEDRVLISSFNFWKMPSRLPELFASQKRELHSSLVAF